MRVNVNGATSSQTGTREGTDTSLDWGEAGQLAGSYVLEGSDEFTGKRLTVTHLPIDDDDVFSFRWSGGTELEGVGVREDSTVSRGSRRSCCGDQATQNILCDGALAMTLGERISEGLCHGAGHR